MALESSWSSSCSTRSTFTDAHTLVLVVVVMVFASIEQVRRRRGTTEQGQHVAYEQSCRRCFARHQRYIAVRTCALSLALPTDRTPTSTPNPIQTRSAAASSRVARIPRRIPRAPRCPPSSPTRPNTSPSISRAASMPTPSTSSSPSKRRSRLLTRRSHRNVPLFALGIRY